MTRDPKLPSLEFVLHVQPATPNQPGRFTLTGQSPGKSLEFVSVLDLVRYLEWVSLGRPRLH